MNKFESSVRQKFDRISKALESGVSLQGIAAELGISLSTLHRYRRQYPEFDRLFEEAKAAEDDLVEAALLRRATGYATCEGKEVPPDVRAAVFWLKNRRPDSWCDRREIAVGEPLEIRLKPEEKEL